MDEATAEEPSSFSDALSVAQAQVEQELASLRAAFQQTQALRQRSQQERRRELEAMDKALSKAKRENAQLKFQITQLQRAGEEAQQEKQQLERALREKDVAIARTAGITVNPSPPKPSVRAAIARIEKLPTASEGVQTEESWLEDLLNSREIEAVQQAAAVFAEERQALAKQLADQQAAFEAHVRDTQAQVQHLQAQLAVPEIADDQKIQQLQYDHDVKVQQLQAQHQEEVAAAVAQAREEYQGVMQEWEASMLAWRQSTVAACEKSLENARTQIREQRDEAIKLRQQCLEQTTLIEQLRQDLAAKSAKPATATAETQTATVVPAVATPASPTPHHGHSHMYSSPAHAHASFVSPIQGMHNKSTAHDAAASPSHSGVNSRVTSAFNDAFPAGRVAVPRFGHTPIDTSVGSAPSMQQSPTPMWAPWPSASPTRWQHADPGSPGPAVTPGSMGPIASSSPPIGLQPHSPTSLARHLSVSQLRTLLTAAGWESSASQSKAELAHRVARAVATGSLSTQTVEAAAAVDEEDGDADSYDSGADASAAVAADDAEGVQGPQPASPQDSRQEHMSEGLGQGQEAMYVGGHGEEESIGGPGVTEQEDGPYSDADDNEADVDNWLEAQTEDGSIYYYHRVTRSVSWEKPERSVAKQMERRISRQQMETAQRQAERAREIAEQEAQRARDAALRQALQGQTTARINAWAHGKDIRLMLNTLTSVIQTRRIEFSAPLASMANDANVKKLYLQAIRLVHPDKVTRESIACQIEAQLVFNALNTSYQTFTTTRAFTAARAGAPVYRR